LTRLRDSRADQQPNEYCRAVGGEARVVDRPSAGSARARDRADQEAAVFVDGRYTLQAAKQVDGKAWTVESLIDPPPESWLAGHLKPRRSPRI